LADALSAAHAAGVLHRDVKPANILLNTYGLPALSDFGFAALSGPHSGPAAESLHITPAYAPPETLRGQGATEFGDVFSLAATLYALLAGQPPRGADSGALVLPVPAEIADRPILWVADTDWRLMEVLVRALGSNSADRPTAASFRDQLASVNLPAEGKRAYFSSSVGRVRSAHDAPPGSQRPQRARTVGKARRRQRRASVMMLLTLAVASFALGATLAVLLLTRR